jgi:23S rRNA (cytosine1962-C5)-methyltransferase
MSRALPEYGLLDSGNGRKLERFGKVVLSRPCPQARWDPELPPDRWSGADATYHREKPAGWVASPGCPERWPVHLGPLAFELRRTGSGQVGLFPEQARNWVRIGDVCRAIEAKHRRPARVLNLFAYTGGSTLAAARAGAEVCHVDGSKTMMEWGRVNAGLNGLEARPIRWIPDDVPRFVARELRRGRAYDLVLLDPPSWGHGARGESFAIADHLPPLLAQVARLSPDSLSAVLLTCHTADFTPETLRELLRAELGSRGGTVTSGEMALEGPPSGRAIPSGSFSWWLSPP